MPGLSFVSSFGHTCGERPTVGVPADGAVQIETRHVDAKRRFLQRIRYAPLDAQRIAARIERSDDDGRTWRLINDALPAKPDQLVSAAARAARVSRLQVAADTRNWWH